MIYKEGIVKQTASINKTFYMKAKRIVLLILLATLLQSAALFFYAGHNHSNDYTLPFVAAGLLGFLFCLLTGLRQRTSVIIITIGSIIALISKIIVDTQVDPTSHNLFPFEIVLTALMASIAAISGVAVGLLCKRFRKTPR